jgi:hypothetical protein
VQKKKKKSYVEKAQLRRISTAHIAFWKKKTRIKKNQSLGRNKLRNKTQEKSQISHILVHNCIVQAKLPNLKRVFTMKAMLVLGWLTAT